MKSLVEAKIVEDEKSVERINEQVVRVGNMPIEAISLWHGIGGIWLKIKAFKGYKRSDWIPAFEKSIKGVDKDQRASCAYLAGFDLNELKAWIRKEKINKTCCRALKRDYGKYLAGKAKKAENPTEAEPAQRVQQKEKADASLKAALNAVKTLTGLVEGGKLAQRKLAMLENMLTGLTEDIQAARNVR